MSYENSGIEEYVFFTTDTDFVPLLDRLSNLDKRVVNTGNELTRSYAVYKDRADDVISIDVLTKAMKYERPPKWYARYLKPPAAVAASEPTAAPPLAAPAPAGKASAPHDAPLPAPPAARPAANLALLAAAADYLAEAGQQAPGLMISRKTVTATLSVKMPEFRVTGLSPFLGCRTYNAMLERIAKQRSDLQLHKYPNGGRAISFRAKENA
jgi:hypothetical protein